MPFEKRHFIHAIALVALCFAGTALAQSGPRVNAVNLKYQGNFKVPAAAGNGFNYGGTGIAYNPNNDSLFLVGHDYDLRTGEISIPAIGGTATLLQPLTNAIAGAGSVGPGETRIGGHFVYKNRLYMTHFIYYDAGMAQTASHYSRPLTLSSGSATGPTRVGPLNPGFYSGYMATVPAEWQAKFGGPAMTGNCCLSIISRSSYGPAAFSFDPENMGNAQPLVYYTQDHQTLGSYGASGSNPIFNGTTRVTGLVFPEGTSSVLFFGLTGIGNYCYGEASHCNDPDVPYKGEHAYPYRAYVWAYDANDLAAVRAGSKQSWSVTPYAHWVLPELGDVNFNFGVGGVAYDAKTGRIFVSEKLVDGERPVIHVYTIDNSVQQKQPAAPSALSVN